MTSLEKAIFIAKILDDKKALDVTVLKVEQSRSVWEYFVIATGQSNTQIKALANEVEAKLEEKEERPLHIEGYASCKYIPGRIKNVLQLGKIMAGLRTDRF